MYKITLFYDWSYRKDAHAKKFFKDCSYRRHACTMLEKVYLMVKDMEGMYDNLRESLNMIR